MQIENGSDPVAVTITGLFDGQTKLVENQFAFVAQTARVRRGAYQADIDGQPARVMVTLAPNQNGARPPMCIATILS